MLRRLLALASIWAIGLTGCATSSSSPVDPLGTAPEDFSIDAVVLRGRGSAEASRVHLRPGRYVMLADGSLHTGDVVADPAADQLPWLTRRLSRAQVAALWSYLQQSGLNDPKIGNEVPNVNLLEPLPGELVYAISFTGGGERWSVLRRAFPDDDAASVDPTTTELIRRLARLSWRSDDPAAKALIVPRRYDFGPDPYARFRRGAAPVSSEGN